MPYIDTPMLFLPPQPPIAVPAEGTLVVGRSRSCDVRLPSGDASRRHAEICASPEGHVIRDLGSTNGTFVNGTQVRSHVLHPGDRIQIGDCTITYCTVGRDPALSDPGLSDEKTVLTERRAPGEVFRGELAQIPTFAVLQILEMGRKTGDLQIDCEEGIGHLWLADGRPVHAETKSQMGFDAALALVNAASGRFSFEPGCRAPEATIEASVTEVLLEATRLLDESRA